MIMRKPLCLGAELQGLHLIWGHGDRLRVLLVHHSPCCPTASPTELAKVVFGVVLEEPRTLILVDFNTYALVALGPAQAFMAIMTLSQMVIG